MQKLKSFFRSEIRWMITIATIIVAVTWSYASLSADMAEVKNDFKEFKVITVQHTVNINEIMLCLERIKAKLNLI